MTKVYFVRHAEPVHSWKDNETRPLTEEGRRDSELVTAFFREIPVDRFYCSPYARSLGTIAGAAEEHGLEILTDRRLRERDSLPGSNSREMIRRRWEDPDYREPGGESLTMVQQRNIQALSEILAANPGKTLVIGTHGTALSTIIHAFRPGFGYADFMRIIDWMPYVVEMEFEGTQLRQLRECFHTEKVYTGGVSR